MAETYLIALTLLLLGIVARGLQAPQRFYEYPYFMAAPFIAFILPQAYSLVHHPLGVNPEAIEAVLLMTLLCVLACLFGYRASVSRWIVSKSQIALDDRRLFRWGVFFVLCGFFFTYLIARMPMVERGGSMWTGRVTIYLFFANLGYPGLAICFRQALRNSGDVAAWFWTIAGSVIPVMAGLLYARREPAALFALTIAMTLYFQRRYVPPRPLVAGALLFATLLIPATSQVRSTLGRTGVTGVWNVDFVGNFKQYLAGSAVLEYRNAAMLMQATQQTSDYGMGRAYWDQLVFRFVPGQLVGRELKAKLMFRSSKQREREEFGALGYVRQTGTTVTGIADSFREFWFFGALFFAGLAVVFKSLWHASLSRQSVFAQLIYVQTCTAAMQSVTHQTANFLPGLLYNLIFIGMAAYFSQSRRQTATSARMATA